MNSGVLQRFVKYMAIATFVAFTFWIGASYLQPTQPGDYHVRQGDIRLSDGQYDKALESFDEALDEAPDHRGALMGRALAFLQSGRDAEAEAEFTHLIQTLERTLAEDDATGRGTLAAAYANRGILKDRQGRYEDALDDYIKALMVDAGAVEGPGVIDKILYGSKANASSVRERAIYIKEQLALPPAERLLRVPEIDARQRMHKP